MLAAKTWTELIKKQRSELKCAHVLPVNVSARTRPICFWILFWLELKFCSPHGRPEDDSCTSLGNCVWTQTGNSLPGRVHKWWLTQERRTGSVESFSWQVSAVHQVRGLARVNGVGQNRMTATQQLWQLLTTHAHGYILFQIRLWSSEHTSAILITGLSLNQKQICTH